MMSKTPVSLVMVAISSTLIAACDSNLNLWKTSTMSTLSPRLQLLFEKTKTVCFGRFSIDVPENVDLSWGEADVPLGVEVLKGQASEMQEKVKSLESALKSEARYPASKNYSLYIETIDGEAGQKIIVSQQSFSSTGMYRVQSYYPMGSDLVVLEALPIEEHRSEAISDLSDMVQRLRPRTETEIPGEPGVCIDHAFLADKPGLPLDKTEGEHIRLGVWIRDFPDVNLSIYTAPANPWDTNGDSLENQIKRTDDDARSAGEPSPYKQLKVFRKGTRQIHDWTTGYEILTKTPGAENVHAYQDFWMKFTGVGKDVFKPYVDIQLKTGVANNAAGAVKPSLTDDEAIALWDRLTSSIRVRPTKAATASQSEARLPLGSLAVTGRICGQSGLWECDEPRAIDGHRQRFIEAGQTMPSTLAQGEATGLWGRLKGEKPVYRAATMWKLVAYDEHAPLVDEHHSKEAPGVPTRPDAPTAER